jgi:ribosomal small subunit protein bTHX
MRMGKGDMRTKKGKRMRGTHGKSRLRKGKAPKANPKPAARPAAKPAARPTKK